MRGIFVGGCHIVGKPHGMSYGFVRLLWKNWRTQERKVHFDLLPYAVNWEALFEACRKALSQEPNFIVLNIQSGLVLPTWERTLKRLGLKRTRLCHEGMPFARVALAKVKTLVALMLDESIKPKVILSDSIKEQSRVEETENWFAPLKWEPQHRGKIYWILKRWAILLLGGHREKWTAIEKEWSRLAGECAQSPVRVIVMTPTPVRDDYFVHGLKNLERVRHLVLAYSTSLGKECYEVCDVYPTLCGLGLEGLWYDGQHLSKEGHVAVAEMLGDMLCAKGESSCQGSRIKP